MKNRVPFKVWRGNYDYDVADWGHLFYMAGVPGSMKSTQISYLIASALAKEPVLGYDLDIGDRTILFVDGEQPQDLYDRGKQRIAELCGGKNMDQLIYPDETMASIPTPRGRRDALGDLITKHHHDLGIIVVDMAGNFVENINSMQECGSFLDRLNTLATAKNCIPIVVSHMLQTKWGSDKLFGMMGTKINQIFSGGMLATKSSKYFGVLRHKTRYPPYPPMWVEADADTGLLTQLPYIPF